jgi:hypothetical protein
MPRLVDQGCDYGCLEAAVRRVHREDRHARGAFRRRLGRVLAATLSQSTSAMPPIVLQNLNVFSDGVGQEFLPRPFFRSPDEGAAAASAPPPDAPATPDKPPPRLAADGRGT